MKYIMERVEEAIIRYPDNNAIICGNTTISYLQMGNYIDAICIQIEQFIGSVLGKSILVYMTPSIESIVVQLAIIKCGAIYVPLDTNTDLDAINIGKLDNVVCLITNIKKITNYKSYSVICIESICVKNRNFRMYESVQSEYSHCILTSGTTGTPKAVLLRQRAILNQVEAKIQILNLNNTSRMCLSVNMSFVASIWQILAMIFVGGVLVVLGDQLRKNPFLMFKAVQDFQATIVCTIPSVMRDIF